MTRLLLTTVLLLAAGWAGMAGAQPSIARDADTGRRPPIRNLTDAQRAKIAPLLSAAAQQVYALLTPEQARLLAALTGEIPRAGRRELEQALARVTPTDAQQARIDAIFDEAEKQVAAIDPTLLPRATWQQATAAWNQARQRLQPVLAREQKRQFADAFRAGRQPVSRDERNRILGLTPEQQAGVKAADDARRQRLEAIRADARLSSADRNRQVQLATLEHDARMRELLTPEQRVLWEQIGTQRRGWSRFGDGIIRLLNLPAQQSEAVQAIKSRLSAEIRLLLDDAQRELYDQYDAHQREQFQQQTDARDGADIVQ